VEISCEDANETSNIILWTCFDNVLNDVVCRRVPCQFACTSHHLVDERTETPNVVLLKQALDHSATGIADKQPNKV
jgi:hypothetical protein